MERFVEKSAGSSGEGLAARPRILRLVLPLIILCAAIAAIVVALAWSSSGDSELEAGVTGVASAPAPGRKAATDIKHVGGAGPVHRLENEHAPVSAGTLAGRIICIDPGHSESADHGVEPVGPDSATVKVKDPGGTSGTVTGVREPVVTLAISRYLRQMLEVEGAIVVMTRTGDYFSGGNRERALVANKSGAQLFVRIHADGSADPSRRGTSTLFPALIPGWTQDIHEQSGLAAAAVQTAMVAQLGVPDLGIVERSDITGFNWSDVPAILVEVGFMSNPEEDVKLDDPAYQQQVAAALAAGITAYFS